MTKKNIHIDIEASSLNIETAKLKFIGITDNITNKFQSFQYPKDAKDIKNIIADAQIVTGFNIKNYDIPIIKNNFNDDNMFDYKVIIDTYEISAPKGKGGIGKYNKNRLIQMGVDLKKFSLKAIIEKLKLDTEGTKGDIDYAIFQKDEWTNEEIVEINKYLKQDVILSKKLFDWYCEQFKPLVKFLPEKDRENFSYLTSNLSVLGYNIICNKAGLKAEFGTKGEVRGKSYEGAHHIEPRWNKVRGLIYNVDFISAYPSSIIQGNLFSHDKEGWSGDNYYKIEGTYNNKQQGKVEIALKDMLLERLKAKKEGDKIKSQAYKICINSIYGLTGNPIFKSLYNHTTASNCTSIVRTWLKKLAKTLEENGFICLYGFTDNIIIFIPENLNKEMLMFVINNFIEEVKSHLPFPLDTFNLELETEMKFIWFVAKNCYLYVTNKNEVKYKSTLLNTNTPKVIMQVFDEYMKSKIISTLDINFEEKELIEQIKLRLKDNPELAGEEFKVMELDEYKSQTSIQYQVTERYGEGTHYLIPNTAKIGIGKNTGTQGRIVRYCSIDEFKANNLTVEDISLNKLLMHLKPFLKEISKPLNQRQREKMKQRTLFDIPVRNVPVQKTL